MIDMLTGKNMTGEEWLEAQARRAAERYEMYKANCAWQREQRCVAPLPDGQEREAE